MRRIQGLGKERGVEVRWAAYRGKGSHGLLYLRVPSSSPSVSLRVRDLHSQVIALPWAQEVAQQFLNFLPLPQGQ